MSARTIRTSESFDFEGFWWEPTADAPPPHPAQGSLRYEPSEGVRLSVVNLRGGPEQALNNASPHIPVLHGITLQGKPCTLLNVVPHHEEGTLFGGHSHDILGSNLLFYGAHVSSAEDLPFLRARVGFRGLAEWLNEPWPPKEATFSELAEDGVLEIPLSRGRLLFQEGREEKNERFSRDLRIDFTALFELDQPTTLPELNENLVRPLHDLLILGTNEEIRVTEITLLMPEEIEKWWGDKKPFKHVNQVSVVQRGQLQWAAENANDFHQVPFPLAVLHPEPVEAIRRWYSLRAELAGAGNSLFATLNRRFRALEVDFLSLLSAAEGYHRARFDALVITEEEHKAATKAMIDALPSNLKENYQKRLQYANEQTQRERLRSLFERAESAVPKTRGWLKIMHPLVQTRNFLTHWGEKSDDVLEPPELILALKKIEIVLRINLMLDLEVDPLDIQGSINVSHGDHAVFAS